MRAWRIRLARSAGGLARGVGTAMEAPVLKGRAGVEVLIMLTGPLMAALIFDIDTLEPQANGLQTLSATTTLPNGSLQAVRANFRYNGSQSSC